jgi:Domain of Unknown Function (DUF1080)
MGKRRWFVALAVVTGLGIQACAQMPSDLAKLGGWTTLIDGETGLENWNRVGDANWRPEDGAIVAYRGKGGFLVSKNSYKDFQLRAEFWADPTTNSGVFLRVSNPKRIGADNAYEVNIFDMPSDPAYGTGAIVNYAKVSPMPKAGGKWNTLEITAKGQELTVSLNGVQTVNLKHARFAQGPVALQYGLGAKNAEGGPIKWRKVQVKPIEAEKPAAVAPKPAAGGGAAISGGGGATR